MGGQVRQGGWIANAISGQIGANNLPSDKIRKIIYTTNAIKSLNRVIRKSIKTRGSFPTEEAATKLTCMAVRDLEKGRRNVPQ